MEEGHFAVHQSRPQGEDPLDPIEIDENDERENEVVEVSDTENAATRRRRPQQVYSVWYGARGHRREPGVRRVPNRERQLMSYALGIVAVIDPHNQRLADQVQHIRAGTWDQIQLPSLQRIYRMLQDNWAPRVRVNLRNA